MSTSIETIRAIYHPTRQRIIDFLSAHGASQVGAIAGALDQQVGSVSHHLRMLEKVEVVERVPELATDGRTSWWRMCENSISWSVDDFADRPADRMQAKVAEKLNVEHQFGKLAAWRRRWDQADQAWRRAAFSNSTTTQATAAELEELQGILADAVHSWSDRIDKDDGQERQPVFVFSHGFPTRP